MPRLPKDQQPVIEAYGQLQQFNQDERLRSLDEAHQRFLHDLATDREEAHERGLAEKAIEIALNMKQVGSDYEFISQMTGLSLMEIEQLN